SEILGSPLNCRSNQPEMPAAIIEPGIKKIGFANPTPIEATEALIITQSRTFCRLSIPLQRSVLLQIW
ncbi:MAG: hypothetical protein ACYT04_92605, partial [Nostoc sp.]